MNFFSVIPMTSFGGVPVRFIFVLSCGYTGIIVLYVGKGTVQYSYDGWALSFWGFSFSSFYFLINNMGGMCVIPVCMKAS